MSDRSPGAPRVRKHRRHVRLPWLVALARIALVAAVPTVGVGATCVAGMVPLVVAGALDLHGNAIGVAIVLAALAWLAAALGVAVGSMKAFGLLGALRAPAGEVVLGADGVRWVSRFRHRFASWAEVERVEVRDGNVVVLHRTGGAAPLRFTCDEAHAMAADAIEAIEHLAKNAPAEPLGALEHTSGSLATWIDATKKLLSPEDYRAAVPSTDRLVEIAADPRASPHQRVGAALALANAPEPVRARVRVAIDETAAPGLGDAMEEALEHGARDHARIARTVRSG